MQRYARSLDQPWMIWFAISLHLVYGSALIIWPATTTALAILGGFDHLIAAFGATATGCILFGFASIAAIGVSFEQRLGKAPAILLLMPQYSLLLYAFTASIVTITQGMEVHSRSGGIVEVMRELIFIGVAPICLTAVWHTAAILARIAQPVTKDERIAMLRGEINRLTSELRQAKQLEDDVE